MNSNILEVRNLKMHFRGTTGLFHHKVAEIRAVDNVSFSIHRGETLGLCGESGCGKTTIARCVARLCQPTDGRILFEGLDISSIPERRLRQVRSRMSMVFQDPYGSLNPRRKIRNIIGEPLRVHHLIRVGDYNDRVRLLCEMVGLDPAVGNRYPHELSGGQRQRIAIARAIASGPAFVICDEPVSSLDASTQMQIIDLLQNLRQEQKKLAYLFISHDLSIIRHISDKVAVMYLGKIVEMASTSELYSNPFHPYTKLLLESALHMRPASQKESRCEYVVDDDGMRINGLKGCAFRGRCFIAGSECEDSVPELYDVGVGHQAACMRI